MLIVKINKTNHTAVIKQAVDVIKHGGVVVYPTETAYGLGADFFNPLAVKKVYQIKGRDFKKPLSMIVSSLVMAKKLVKFDKISLNLAKKYWPGPLTLIQKSKIKNQKFNAKFKTLGLRISANKLATLIVKQINSPITATSANLSGRGEFYSAAEIVKQFKKRKYQPDLIIDAGRLPKKKTSTIAMAGEHQIKILRQGSIVIPHEST